MNYDYVHVIPPHGRLKEEWKAVSCNTKYTIKTENIELTKKYKSNEIMHFQPEASQVSR